MAVNIHPTAIVDPGAELGDGVEIGAYAVLGPRVTLGQGCTVGPHAVIQANTRLGARCKVYSHAAVGFDPQDLKFKGELSWFEAGEDNVFREFCTMHRGTGEGGRTVAGDRNLFMAYTHLAHDCQVGSDNIMSNNASLAGHVTVENNVVIAGFAAVHQFARIGEYAMIGGGSMISKDVMPYVIISGDIAELYGINLVGLRRHGFTREEIQAVEEAYKIVFRGKLNTTQAVEALEALPDPGRHVRHWIEFIKSSQRGIHK